MIKAAGQLVPLKVDAEKEGVELAKKYKVTGYPTILFMNADGEIFGTIGGYVPAPQFIESVQTVVDVYKAYPAAVEALKKNADDPSANVTMARVYAARGDTDKAIAALKRAEAGKYAGPDFAKAYSAVGDAFQNAQDPSKAIPYFDKAIAVAKTPGDKAYALVSAMFCSQMNQDEAGAKRYARALVSLAGAPKEYVDMAKQVLGGG